MMEICVAFNKLKRQKAGGPDSNDLDSLYHSEDQLINWYMTDSYSSKSYEKYFLDSPTEELIEPSSFCISGNSIHPDGASSYQLRVSFGDSTISSNPFYTSFLSTRHRDAYKSDFGSDFIGARISLKHPFFTRN
ncbi:hypothetical protein VNO77_04087 [Canavalia gladiata]|uniref:Uncharacterized protein n=1 Tax=Canavalia gladiata TaxID=3824 RepID=A0AAN9MVW8_CANGL